jgi:hypothetical protein
VNIEVAGTLIVEDFVAVNNMQESVYQRIGMYIQIGLVVIGLALWVSVAPRIGMVLVALGILDMVGERLWSRFVSPRRDRKLFDLLTDLHGHIVYDITDRGIGIRNQRGKSHHSWSEYLDLGEDERTFALFRSETMIEILPKRWFAASETIDEFRELALAQILKSLELETAAESD